jgi:hypothetical protein
MQLPKKDANDDRVSRSTLSSFACFLIAHHRAPVVFFNINVEICRNRYGVVFGFEGMMCFPHRFVLKKKKKKKKLYVFQYTQTWGGDCWGLFS